MRAAQISAGYLIELMDKYIAQLLSELWVIVSGCKEQLQWIVSDFQRGVDHICYIIRIKTAVFLSNPLKILALGHPDENVARMICAESLAEAKSAEQSGTPVVKMHYWIRLLTPACLMKLL